MLLAYQRTQTVNRTRKRDAVRSSRWTGGSSEANVTFLKKGILFSLEWGDVTLFALGLGERWFAGISFSSASKPVASMSIAIYRQTIQKSSGRQERKNRLYIKKKKMKANKLNFSKDLP